MMNVTKNVFTSKILFNHIKKYSEKTVVLVFSKLYSIILFISCIIIKYLTFGSRIRYKKYKTIHSSLS